jgi:hypothetical protein
MQTFSTTSQSSTTSQPWQEVLDRLPLDLDLDALAFASGALKRRREVGDGPTLLRLAMARGPGGLSLNQTAAWAAMQDLAQLSDPGVKYRLDQAVPFLKALLEQQLAERAGGPTLCWPGRSLRVVDGSPISQPGSQGSDWLIHAGYDLGGGGFCHLELTDKHGAESVLRGAPIAGEVRVGDRNFATAKGLHSLRVQSHGQADFVVRAGWKAFALSGADGTAFDLIGHRQALPRDQQPHEVLVQAQVDQTTQLPLRLIILRFSPEETAKIHKRLRRRAQRDRKKLDPRTLVAAEFLILATSLPAELYPAQEVLAMYRLRGIIEPVSRPMKPHGLRIEASRIEDVTGFTKPAIIGLIAAIRSMQLVMARDGTTGQPLTDAVDPADMPVLRALNASLQGRIEKLRNPHDESRLAWYAWIVARLGGWSGRHSRGYRPPGPKTMHHGLLRLDAILAGWGMADRSKDVRLR